MADRPPTRLPAGSWKVDPSRSRIGYSAGPHRGTFDDHAIALVVAARGEAGLTATVAGARFAATAIRRDGDLLEVDGEVTVAGRTLAVTTRGTVDEPAGALVLELGTVVDRRQFGIDSDIGPEVAVEVRLTLVRDREP